MTRLIDADALKDLSYINKGNFNSVEGIWKWIDNAPTVEVGYLTNCANCERVEKIRAKRPQGKWIITSEDAEGIHCIKCPFCKYEKGSEFEPYIKVAFDKLPYFCENCGADLREEAEYNDK